MYKKDNFNNLYIIKNDLIFVINHEDFGIMFYNLMVIFNNITEIW